MTFFLQVLYDLGCGDGRICIAAHERSGCLAAGVEIEQCEIDKFRASIASKGLAEKVRIIHGDLLELDLADATIITLYLLPAALEQIKPKLLECLERGCRVVCHFWPVKGWVAERVATYGNSQCNVYLFTRESLGIGEAAETTTAAVGEEASKLIGTDGGR
jgi:SAM-dependent methyltransferase